MIFNLNGEADQQQQQQNNKNFAFLSQNRIFGDLFICLFF